MIKRSLIAISLICAALWLSGCSGKAVGEENKTENISSTYTDDSVLAGEEFERLPAEAAGIFGDTVELAKELFADAKGKWMYGYKGVSSIGGDSCYIFAVYTVNDNVYSKEGVIARNVSGDGLYLLNEATGEYTKAVCADTQTISFAVK